MYFDNTFVENKLNEYRAAKTSVEKNEILDELQPIFSKLIEGVIAGYKLNRNNTVNDDLRQEAMIGIYKAIEKDKWDKTIASAFTFFTVVARNYMFWFLKNEYQDTSIDKEKNITSSELSNNREIDYDFILECDIQSLVDIKNFVEKTTAEDLFISKKKRHTANLVLRHLKKHIMNFETKKDILNLIQRETKIPKKKIAEIMDAIYKSYTIGD